MITNMISHLKNCYWINTQKRKLKKLVIEANN